MGLQIVPLLLLTSFLLTSTTQASFLPHQTPLPLPPKNTTSLKHPRSNGWSPAVLLQDNSGICPQYAYINCLSISGPNYCCGPHTYCAYGGPENHIGCCADGDVCDGQGGEEPPSPYTTVVVPSATGTTFWTQSGTTQTGLIGPAYTVTTTTTATQFVTGPDPTICSTLYAHGGDLPTTAAAQCGLVLVLNGARGRGVDGVGLAAGLAVLNGFTAVLGWMGLF